MGKKDSYPRITATAKIKKCVIDKCADIHFEGLELAPDQYETIARWRANDDELLVSIQQKQGTLPLKDD
ncbi:MAG: hypothetical protein AMJ84_03005 [Acidithiobacillales bacterium SM23_46]|nr:MAG: hypothetical protein AMJ84_03005 [Acidithiobacillales bacterium SM23_46]KPL27879.1 MAG: hypothetical protein AMJ72_06310 [Acidithiobacillales bacterium SM1_46]